MTRVTRTLFSVLLLSGAFSVTPALGPCAGVANAEGVKRAGLVVQFERRPAREFCVAFSESSITGFDLLQRSGLALTFQDYGGGNVAVCAIEGDGCAYPRQACFCRCTNLSDCTMWGYYRMDAAATTWTFSEEGAGVARVRDGDVNGWRWGKHSTTGGQAPDATTLSAICAEGEQVGLKSAGARNSVRTGAGGAAGWGLAGAAAVFGGLIAWGAARRRSRRVEEQ